MSAVKYHVQRENESKCDHIHIFMFTFAWESLDYVFSVVHLIHSN